MSKLAFYDNHDGLPIYKFTYIIFPTSYYVLLYALFDFFVVKKKTMSDFPVLYISCHIFMKSYCYILWEKSHESWKHDIFGLHGPFPLPPPPPPFTRESTPVCLTERLVCAAIEPTHRPIVCYIYLKSMRVSIARGQSNRGLDCWF